MVEDLDDFSAVDHFLDNAFRRRNIFLLGNEVAGGLSADRPGDEDRHERSEDNDKSHPDAVIHHDAEDRRNGDHGDHQLREGLRYHLTHGVYVIGVIGHDRSALVGVKITDRKFFHMREHLIAQFRKGSLRKECHQLVIQDVRKQRCGIQAGQCRDVLCDIRLHAFPGKSLFPCGLDDCDHLLLEDGRNCGNHRVDADENHDARKQFRIILKQHPDQPQDRSLAVLFFRLTHAAASETVSSVSSLS